MLKVNWNLKEWKTYFCKLSFRPKKNSCQLTWWKIEDLCLHVDQHNLHVDWYAIGTSTCWLTGLIGRPTQEFPKNQFLHVDWQDSLVNQHRNFQRTKFFMSTDQLHVSTDSLLMSINSFHMLTCGLKLCILTDSFWIQTTCKLLQWL